MLRTHICVRQSQDDAKDSRYKVLQYHTIYYNTAMLKKAPVKKSHCEHMCFVEQITAKYCDFYTVWLSDKTAPGDQEPLLLKDINYD